MLKNDFVFLDIYIFLLLFFLLKKKEKKKSPSLIKTCMRFGPSSSTSERNTVINATVQKQKQQRKDRSSEFPVL